MNDYQASRLAALDPRHLVIACQALVARLRRIHEGFDVAPEEQQEERAAAHVEAVEALLNLLSVVESDPRVRAEDVRLLRAGLDRALESAREREFGRLLGAGCV